jgi:2-iminobutanoate/2-iminopropanoate deaminase
MMRWSLPAGLATLHLVPALEAPMPIVRFLVLLFVLALLSVPSDAQDGGIKIEKFTHSEWTRGIFSEAVTVTGIGNAKFVYLAGVGAEDENGPRGNVRHHGNFLEQCRYAYDKIKRVLAHHGAGLRDVVKVTTYITDLRHRLTMGKCIGETWGDITFPTNTLIGVGALAFPEMIIEVDVTAIVTAK